MRINIDEWFKRYPYRNLCAACGGTGLRPKSTTPCLEDEPCLECLGDRLHFALFNWGKGK
jgi:hypothetical protein